MNKGKIFKSRKKTIASVLVALVLMIGALPVYAYTGYYSFDITTAVFGSNVHSLASRMTSTTVSAQSYDYVYNVSSTKYQYTVELYRDWLTKYNTYQLLADGNSYTTSYGVIASGNYTINVFKNTGSSSNRVVGSGTISQ